MKIKKLDDRVIITNEINNKFLKMFKDEIKNPFSVPILKSDIKVGIEFEFFIPLRQDLTVNEKIDDLDEKVEHFINNLSFLTKQ